MNLVRTSGLNKRLLVCCKNVPAKRCVSGTRCLSSEDKENGDKQSCSIDDIEEPTNCCMSGCANCVWIQYAEKLSDALVKSDVDIQKVIMEKVQDPNMRAFLSMELRCRNLVK